MNWKDLHAASAGILLALVVGFLALPSLWRIVTPLEAPKTPSEGTQIQPQDHKDSFDKVSGLLIRQDLETPSNVEPLTGLLASITAIIAVVASFLIARRFEAKAR